MSHPLTLTSPTYNSSGKFGSSLNGGYGEASGVITQSTVTVTGWCKGATTGSNEVLFGMPNCFYVIRGTTTLGGQYGTAGVTLAAGGPNVTDGAWHFVEFNAGPAGGYLFVDGTQVAHSATTGAASSMLFSSPFGVSDFPGNGFFWTGEVDDVAVYDGVQMHTSSYTPPTTATDPLASGLTALYNLDGNGLDTAGVSPAATAVTMSGPTSGTAGVASTNFTIGANGDITGTVIVTPSDSGAGGTFTPTTVSISSGSPTGTFTYTAASSGSKTISVTNNGSLSNPSNITFVASSGAATAVTMSGPSSGTVGVASTNFTIGANGTITGTVTVTPSDSGGGGTFTPTSVAISSGTPTATFTYTPASTGAKTISVTNNGSLSNPSNITYTASASATKPADDAGIVYSPSTWLVSGGVAKTINTGAYFKTVLTGTSCTLNFNLTGKSTPYARLRICVDGLTAQAATVAATVSVTLSEGGGPRLLEVYIDATTESVSRWSTQAAGVAFTGITLSSSGQSLTAPATRPRTMLFYGDSIAEGTSARPINDPVLAIDVNTAVGSFALELGKLLGAETGVIAFGGQGLLVSGAAGVPTLGLSWDSLWSGQSRSFSPTPDYCIWLEGQNDSTGNTTSAAISALNGMLTAMPGTQFVLFRPLAGTAQETYLQAAAAGCNEPDRVTYISTAGFWDSSQSGDGVHPRSWACLANIAPLMAQAIADLPALGSATAGFPSSSRLGGVLQT
jgi:hypothetical protein